MPTVVTRFGVSVSATSARRAAVVHDDDGVDDRVAEALVPELVSETARASSRAGSGRADRSRAAASDRSARLAADQRPSRTMIASARMTRRLVLVHLERHVDLVRGRGVDDAVSTVGLAIAALPVVQPDAQDVATQLGLVEVVLVLERRRVAEQAEQLEKEASARRTPASKCSFSRSCTSTCVAPSMTSFRTSGGVRGAVVAGAVCARTVSGPSASAIATAVRASPYSSDRRRMTAGF